MDTTQNVLGILIMPRRGSMGRDHQQPEGHKVGTFNMLCDIVCLIELILTLEPDLVYDAAEHDDMIIDSKTTPTQMILGMPSSPKQCPRVRHSYPVSTTEWTEYTSPLKNPQVNFYIDSTGDRSQPTSMSCHHLICRNHISISGRSQ